MKLKGLPQALGVAVYCLLVGGFMFNMGKFFDSGPDGFLAPVAVLMLFSVSALICALLVFYYPYKLFIEKKKKEAAEQVLYTTAWLFAFFTIFLLLAVTIK
jgi:hypothetical protein